MDWPFEQERVHEIGARFKRQRLSAETQYRSEMRACWSEIYRVLKPGGKVAVVIGESRAFPGAFESTRSGERRVGKEWVSTCRSRWATVPEKKKKAKTNSVDIRKK